MIGNEVVEETEKIGDSFSDGTLLMENQSAQSRREFKREYFVLAAAFQREPFSLSNLPSGGEMFLDSRRAPAMYSAQRRLDCQDMNTQRSANMEGTDCAEI